MNRRWVWTAVVAAAAILGWFLWSVSGRDLGRSDAVGGAVPAKSPTSSLAPSGRRVLPTRRNPTGQERAPEAGSGQVVGRVVWRGEPVGGRVELQPLHASELQSGWHAVRHTEAVGASGAFEVDDVAPGRWSVRVTAMADGARIDRILDEVTLASEEHLDLGDIEVGGTGGMSGRVVPLPDSDSAVTIVFAEPASSDTPGARTQDFVRFPRARFSLSGLSQGSWRVWDARDPASAVYVDVVAGEVAEGVEIAEPETWVQPDLGCAFELQTAGSHTVVSVASVVPGGPADQAGLRPGDPVLQVESGSFDESSGKGEPAPEAAEGLFALTLSGGRTARVTVERDGKARPIQIP